MTVSSNRALTSALRLRNSVLQLAEDRMLSGQIVRQRKRVMSDLLSLDGRIVVVSGAGGGGIGTTVTAMVAEAGATVIAVSRSKENLDEHVVPLTRRGLAVVPVAADASTDDGIATVMDHV